MVHSVLKQIILNLDYITVTTSLLPSTQFTTDDSAGCNNREVALTRNNRYFLIIVSTILNFSMAVNA